MAKTDISVVIPVYNEAENIAPLHAKLSEALRKMRKTCEVIFIDDGSTDATFSEMQKLRKKNGSVRLIKMRKNFGQTTAVSAGFSNARGEIVITMDGDMQNNPEDIPALVSKIDEGYDVVSGWRHSSQDSFSKRLFSKISNFIARKLTGMSLHDFGCSLKAYRMHAIKNLELFGEMHRFVPALLNTQGYKIAEMKVRHSPRIHGKTKYGMGRFVKGFLALIYIKVWSDYSTRPLHLFGFLSIITLAAAVVIFLYKILSALFIYKIYITADPLLIFSGILVLASIQFLIFGFLGEIIIRNYHRSAGDLERRIEKVE